MTPFAARNVLRLAALTGLGLVAVSLATAYWGYVRAAELAVRPDNPRLAASDRRIERGAILDRAGRTLARTEWGAGGEPRRLLLVGSAAPVVGYQTWSYGRGANGRAYGAGGAEAAFDAVLRGDVGVTPADRLGVTLLHRPPRGRDIRLTIDAVLQEQAAALLAGRPGAVVVLAVGTGEVRALATAPTFDAAVLDAPGAAEQDMLNRATQGLYPPGSTWKTVTLAGALAAGTAHLDDMLEDGSAG
jgi:peptidoglycan glycosyltransferase